MSHHLRKFIEVWNHSSVEFRKRVYWMLAGLLILNGGVWALTAMLGLRYPILYGLVAISYGLGLRHAVDADHIAAIDNTTRKLLQEKKKPVGVGFFFSFGHSTVVIVLAMTLAFFSSFVQAHVPQLQAIGSIVGTLVSSIFLFFIGAINAVTLVELVRKRKYMTEGDISSHGHHHTHGGILMKLFNPVFSSVTKSWHMYPVGFLFGLGFDTASEIALLSISATTGASGFPIWTVLLLPIAFTAAMALIDSLDGLLMLGAYGWAFVTPMRKLTYNISITGISVLVAFGIGTMEVLQILGSRLTAFPQMVSWVSSVQLGTIGIGIIFVFAIIWFASYLLSIYKNGNSFSA